jgi:hypothetical protein
MVDSKKNALTARTITLYDKDEKKVAVCLQGKKTSIGGPVDFSIYGVNPMYDGHKVCSLCENRECIPLLLSFRV